MFLILFLLAVIGFFASLIRHIKVIFCIFSEAEVEQLITLTFPKWELVLHFGLMLGNCLLFILEQLWDGTHFVKFFRDFWKFLPLWAKLAIALFLIYSLIIVLLPTNWFRPQPGKRRIYKQDGKYWIQQVYFLRRGNNDTEMLEEVNLSPVEITKAQYVSHLTSVDSIFTIFWMLNYLILALYFWYKAW
ncbi:MULTISPECIES: hypothetical protein [Fischerella]|uniref:Uncharacterized protein n=1 Tax=Fischerella muscicola CCMEE 5323 TaxID=2019572 RepID=A0A2N6JYE3_FISMU|nr:MULTISPECIES: hypothetical protein [Fischerella]MBD2430097.1 hypothetical protein [Fischerella sp. FACHB-380]PLZ85898.1 hypothetical protein CEN44_21170 [Fischerella muscicola CCMEE 5323]